MPARDEPRAFLMPENGWMAATCLGPLHFFRLEAPS
jgi:hypothetical protein